MSTTIASLHQRAAEQRADAERHEEVVARHLALANESRALEDELEADAARLAAAYRAEGLDPYPPSRHIDGCMCPECEAPPEPQTPPPPTPSAFPAPLAQRAGDPFPFPQEACATESLGEEIASVEGVADTLEAYRRGA